jgi:hypothetical protein
MDVVRVELMRYVFAENALSGHIIIGWIQIYEVTFAHVVDAQISKVSTFQFRGT